MSETMKALALALRTGPPQTACCTDCGEPLIATMAWSYFEFYCLCCGKHLGFVEPDGKDAPEVAARYDELRAEWDENVGGKILPEGSFGRSDCEACRSGGGYDHRSHATEEEISADVEARAWLRERAGLDELPPIV